MKKERQKYLKLRLKLKVSKRTGNEASKNKSNNQKSIKNVNKRSKSK